jgi:two-component system NtrC family response regulator
MADHLTHSPGGFNPVGAQAPRKPKLLIVEDDDTLRTQKSWALAEEYEACEAKDRETALEVFRKERPALVTLDLGLPLRCAGVEEGFLALGAILDIDSTAKIVVVTGRAEWEYRQNALANGAYDFFSKPYDLDELKIVLRRAHY